MQTELVTLGTADDAAVFARAGEILRAGGLVAFPTETVYGLGGNALDPAAADKIFAAKGRPGDNPLIVHVADPRDAEAFAVTNADYYRLAERFMPGPLTVILPKKENIPDSVTGGLPTVAVRCPENRDAGALIAAAGVPIAAPSANRSGSPSPTTAAHVLADLGGRIDMILDGGPCAIGVESTVIALSEDGCTVLRPGEILPRELASVMKNVHISPAVTDPDAAGDRPQSPGMKYRHYAPQTKLVLIEGDREGFRAYVNAIAAPCGVLAYTEDVQAFLGKQVIDLGAAEDPGEQMRRLFRILREADSLGVPTVYAPLPPKTDEYLALYNRILRAAGCEVISLPTKGR